MLILVAALVGCAEPAVPHISNARVQINKLPREWDPAFWTLWDRFNGDIQGNAIEAPDVVLTIDVVEAKSDGDCVGGCFAIEGRDGHFTVQAEDVLGAQYGVDAVLQMHGYGLRHPFEPEIPDNLTFVDDGTVGAGWQVPETRRRGIHLHTLHPIEGLDAMWGDDDIDRPKAILDWLVWNRGNYIQWPGLDDISESTYRHDDWAERTKEIVESAHRRGVQVGVGVQLFGTSNLQRAFDLIDDPGTHDEDAASVSARLNEIAGLGFDNINLSFGEFSGEDADTFIDRINVASGAAEMALPDAEMSAVIHVGNYDDLRVEYQGNTYLYYFLVQFADPRIVPWVHSVMYYDLFEDAGGAYLHEEFDEHREFLISRLEEGKPAAYFPETAYWIAFDDSIPIWTPVYVRSRWTDLRGLRDRGVTLDEHILFSSGWEWGYWQNDVAALRMSWKLPETPDELWPELLGAGAPADAAAAVMNVEHDALIDQRMAPWLAGRDLTMDLGDKLGIVAAPDRPTWAEIVAMTPEEQAAFVGDVVTPLRTFAAALDDVGTTVVATDRWSAEVVDGIAVTAARARYSADLIDAVLAEDSATAGEFLDAADADAAAARAVIDRRHADLHDGRHWTEPYENATVYKFGYLYHAETMCFWERERVQVRKLILGEAGSDPGCAL